MKPVQRVFILFAAGILLLSLSACMTTPDSGPQKPDLSLMTPEERENYEALQRARKRVEEKSRTEVSSNRSAPAQRSRGSQFRFERNSEEKRRRLGDTSRPVLLNDDSSIFKWRDDGRRSDTLRRQQEERRSTTD